MRSIHMLGARSSVGFDYQKLAGGLLSTAGDVATSIQADEAAKKASAAEKAKAEAAIAADRNAALAKAAALTTAALAERSKSDVSKAKAAADQQALEVASSAQDAAGAAVSATAAPLRLAAAQKGLADATAKLQAAPTDLYTQNLVKAWTWTINKVQNGQIVKNLPDQVKIPADHWYSAKIVGPVKVWHGGVILAALGGLWYAVKKGLFSRLFGG